MRKSIFVPLVIMFMLVGALATLAGCGEKAQEVKQDLSSNPDVQELKAALTVMTQSSTYDSIDTFEAAWSQVESAYDAVVTDAQAIGQDISGLEDAFASLKDSVSNISSDETLQQKATDIQSAVKDFQNAVKAISPTATTPSS